MINVKVKLSKFNTNVLQKLKFKFNNKSKVTYNLLTFTDNEANNIMLPEKREAIDYNQVISTPQFIISVVSDLTSGCKVLEIVLNKMVFTNP